MACSLSTPRSAWGAAWVDLRNAENWEGTNGHSISILFLRSSSLAFLSLQTLRSEKFRSSCRSYTSKSSFAPGQWLGLGLGIGVESQPSGLPGLPHRGESVLASEPFELTASEWELLSHVDGERSLSNVHEVVNLPAPEFMKMIRALKERGFIRLQAREPGKRKGG